MFIKYGVPQAILLLAMVYFIGIVKTSILLIALFQILRPVLDHFGFEFAVGQDIMHFFDTEKVIPNCVGYIEMEKVDAKKLKDECFYKRGIMNVRKLRQVPRNILGFYFWQDVASTEAAKQFEIVDYKFESADDITKYCNEWVHQRIPRSKPQWEMKFIENHTETTSVMLMKCHHSMTDGMGIVTLFALLNDEAFKPKLIPKFNGFTWMQKFMVALFVPVALVQQYSVALFFKLKECNRIIHTPTRTNTGDSVFLTTKTYDFADLRKSYKQYDKVTFNNYVMGVLGKSIHQWYAQNGVAKPGPLVMSCPVNMKPFPDSIEKVNLNNGTSAVTIHLPVVGDLKEAIYTAKERFAKHFKLPTLLAALELQRFFSYVPPAIGRAIYNFCTKDIDLVMTNVKGTTEPLYLCNKKIHSITPFLGLFSNIGLIVVCNSYNEKVSFTITADRHIQMDPTQLRDFIAKNLDDKILELKTN